MSILQWILILFLLAEAYVPSKRALQMFQQNRYENGRYASWMKQGLGDKLTAMALAGMIALAAMILALIFRPGTVILAAAAAVCAFLLYTDEKGQNYIKPLVVTARVKRQIAVQAVLLFLFSFLLVRTGLSFLSVMAMLVMPWLIVFLTGWITLPVEKSVHAYYLNDAKRILREHTGLISVGITGSYGKTSTKNIMQAMLSEQYNSLMTPASYNTPMGIARTIREMLKPIHKVFICEMGADHVGDITELMNFVHPSIGVVTSIGPQHLLTFGSQENITREKMQMAELLPSDGVAVLNYDNALIREYRIRNQVKVITYGIEYKDADYRAEDISYSASGSSFTVVHGDERIGLETKLLGNLNILNILSAVACARYLGVEWKTIRRAVKNMKQVEHRLELKIINGHRFIDDAFNANPAGSAMALDVLSMMPGRRVIVTPGMIDLGERQAEINREFGRRMKGKADTVILVGRTQTAPIAEGLKETGFDTSDIIIVDTVKEAFAYVYQNTGSQDTILLENDLPDAFSY